MIKIRTAAPTLQVQLAIHLARIYDLMITANEYAGTYWAHVAETNLPAGVDFSSWDLPDYHFRDNGTHRWPEHVAALVGGSVTYAVIDDDGEIGSERYVLDADAIARGFALMAAEYSRHFGDFLAGNEDAVTGDVFLQCCLFGQVKYG